MIFLRKKPYIVSRIFWKVPYFIESESSVVSRGIESRLQGLGHHKVFVGFLRKEPYILRRLLRKVPYFMGLGSSVGSRGVESRVQGVGHHKVCFVGLFCSRNIRSSSMLFSMVA